VPIPFTTARTKELERRKKVKASRSSLGKEKELHPGDPESEKSELEQRETPWGRSFRPQHHPHLLLIWMRANRSLSPLHFMAKNKKKKKRKADAFLNGVSDYWGERSRQEEGEQGRTNLL